MGVSYGADWVFVPSGCRLVSGGGGQMGLLSRKPIIPDPFGDTHLVPGLGIQMRCIHTQETMTKCWNMAYPQTRYQDRLQWLPQRVAFLLVSVSVGAGRKWLQAAVKHPNQPPAHSSQLAVWQWLATGGELSPVPCPDPCQVRTPCVPGTPTWAARQG